MFQGFACMIAGDHRGFVFGDELFRHVLVFWLPFKAYMEHSALCSILECYDGELIAFKGLQYLYSTPTKKKWSWMWRLFFVAWFMIDNWITNVLHTKLTFFPIFSWDLNVIERYKNSNTLNEMQSIFIGLLILIKGNVARDGCYVVCVRICTLEWNRCAKPAPELVEPSYGLVLNWGG